MIEEGGGGGREVQCSLVSFDSESSVEFSSLFIYVIGRAWSRGVVITITCTCFELFCDISGFDVF